MSEREVEFLKSKEQQQKIPWLNLNGKIRYAGENDVALLLHLHGASWKNPNTYIEVTIDENNSLNSSLKKFLGDKREVRRSIGCLAFKSEDSIELRLTGRIMGIRESIMFTVVEGDELNSQLQLLKNNTQTKEKKQERKVDQAEKSRRRQIRVLNSAILSAADIPARKPSLFHSGGRPVQGGAPDSNRRRH